MTETLHFGAERSPFVMLPTWLLQARAVSDGAKVLYCHLHDLVAGREGPTTPVTRGQLAGRCGVSVDTVDRRLGELIAAGAVDKQAQFETRQGQLANVYWVRLSPPAAGVRPAVDNPPDPGRSCAAPPAAATRPAPPQPCGEPRRNGAAPTAFKEQEQEIPPQPPRTAGGPDAPQAEQTTPAGGGRRGTGTSLRAVGMNPRAEADRAAEAKRQAEFERRQADLAAANAQRQADEDAARQEAKAFAAETLALSALLDHDHLAAITETATRGLAGPLQRSSLAVSHAVVSWCRTAVATQPGATLVEAVDAALAAGIDSATGESPPLVLPSPAAGSRPLRERLTPLLHMAETVGATP